MPQMRQQLTQMKANTHMVDKHSELRLTCREELVSWVHCSCVVKTKGHSQNSSAVTFKPTPDLILSPQIGFLMLPVGCWEPAEFLELNTVVAQLVWSLIRLHCEKGAVDSFLVDINEGLLHVASAIWPEGVCVSHSDIHTVPPRRVPEL